MEAEKIQEVGAMTPRRQEFLRKVLDSVQRFRDPVRLVYGEDGDIDLVPVSETGAHGSDMLVGVLPPLYPEWLGDRGFAETHGCRFPYVVGEMARGITTAHMVVTSARAGLMSFFGSAGLDLSTIEDAVGHIRQNVPPGFDGWGANLIHNPNEPGQEDAVVDLFLRLGVRRMSASAFMSMTPAIIRYAATGLHRDAAGTIKRQNHVFAKISRPEIAALFLSPPQPAVLAALVQAGQVTADEADLAARVPVAEDITVEADSGGHTDNRTLTTLFPTIARLRDDLTAQFAYSRTIRLGAAGGLGTPSAVAAAFNLGAAYVVTGSVNQSAVESGLSEDGRRMLAEAGIADVIMAPAADMFERGVEVQVLKRGTLFAQRAQWLYHLYQTYEGLEQIPAAERQRLERDVLREPAEDVWKRTRDFFSSRNPAEVTRAEKESKHRMALVFRWYLFTASEWARKGNEERRADYQVWCGPAMGAFNAWTQGSFLAVPENRNVVQIARNLLEGGAAITRAQQLRSHGVPVPASAFDYRPRPLE